MGANLIMKVYCILPCNRWKRFLDISSVRNCLRVLLPKGYAKVSASVTFKRLLAFGTLRTDPPYGNSKEGEQTSEKYQNLNNNISERSFNFAPLSGLLHLIVCIHIMI